VVKSINAKVFVLGFALGVIVMSFCVPNQDTLLDKLVHFDRKSWRLVKDSLVFHGDTIITIRK